MYAPARRCIATTTLTSLLTALLLLLPASGARASHEAIAIDGDLTDLIQAVNDNLGDGGFKDEADALGEIYTGKCAFVNGFDMRKVYVLVDYKDGLGNYTPNDVTLYAGWQVEGNVGDTDGDGDPDQLTPGSPGESSGCATSDGAGIAATDAYSIRFDLNCASPSFGSDMEIAVTDNKVYKVVGVVYTLLPGATFVYDGSFLELKVPNYQDLIVDLPVEADLCNVRISLAADSREDGPGEDRIANPFLLSVAPSIAVRKDPPVQEICPGSDVSWTIVVKNDGLCMLDEVSVYDTLGVGMTFESSNPVSIGDPSIRSWAFTDLAPGDSITITLTAATQSPCAAETLYNSVLAEGVHSSPCRPEPEGASATDRASVTCRDLPACDITGGTTGSVGDTLELCTTVDGTAYDLAWSAVSDPADIFEFDGPTDGECVKVILTGTGSITVTLDVTDPSNPEICSTSCEHEITVGGDGFACPHTIGFWRQQCAQRGNGSTKVCKAGMDNLWRCVIEATDVNQWKKNDGTFESTASLAALSDSQLFDKLCSQLDGPRPMTLLDMAEIQYLGLMLNVCSGALPLNIEISNGFNGTVAEAIDEIEEAINTGVDVGFWKDVADDINNRIGVLAQDCEDGNALFENLPPCGNPDAPTGFNPESVGNLDLVQTRPFPNPVLGSAATIFYNVPSRLGATDVSIVLFDVSGRAVRTLVSDNKAAGQYTADWDLRDDSGADVVSGIYFYRLTVGGETITQKMMVVRN